MEDRDYVAVAHLDIFLGVKKQEHFGVFLQIMKKITERIKLFYKECIVFSGDMRKNHLDVYSSSTAFFIFLSIIPFILLLMAIIPYTPVSDDFVYNIVLDFLPDKLDDIAYDIMRQVTNESVAIVYISIIAAAWSSARGVQYIKKGLNEIHGVIENRNFALIRLNAIFFTLLLIVMIVIMFTLSLFSKPLFDYIISKIHPDIISGKHIIINALFNLKGIIILFITFFTTLFMFVALPNERLKVKTEIPGAIFVAAIWYIFSTLFNIYITNFNAFSMYGSLSFVIIVLLWLYFCMYIFFIGAQFNYYLSTKANKDKIN